MSLPGVFDHVLPIGESRRELEVLERRREQLLLPESVIAAHSTGYRPHQGIYFLVSQGRVVYVGKSEHIQGRLVQHYNDWSKDFDSWFWVPCETDSMVHLESAYIAYLDPPLNKRYSDHLTGDIRRGAGRDLG